MNKPQAKYAVIEICLLLALAARGCMVISGKEVIIETDHMPLARPWYPYHD